MRQVGCDGERGAAKQHAQGGTALYAGVGASFVPIGAVAGVIAAFFVLSICMILTGMSEAPPEVSDVRQRRIPGLACLSDLGALSYERRLVCLVGGALLGHLIAAQLGVTVTTDRLYRWVLLGVVVAVASSSAGCRHGRRVLFALDRQRAVDRGRPSAVAEGLVVAMIAANLVFALRLPSVFGVSLAVVAVPLASLFVAWGWIAWWRGAAVSARAPRPTQWSRSIRSSTAATSAAIALGGYTAWHAMQLRAIDGAGAEADIVRAAVGASRVFDRHQALLLLFTLGLGLVLSSMQVRQARQRLRASLSRVVASVAMTALILFVGWLLPRWGPLRSVRADVLHAQAMSLSDSGDPPVVAHAVTLEQLALDLQPREAVYWASMANLLDRRTRWLPTGRERRANRDRAMAALAHAVDLQPLDPSTYLELARLQIAAGVDAGSEGLGEAARNLEIARTLQPSSASVARELGRLALARDDRLLASAHLQTALRLNPNDGRTYLETEQLLDIEWLGTGVVSVDGLSKLGGRLPAWIDSASAYSALVGHFTRAGQLRRALRAAEALSLLRPQSSVGFRARGELFYRLGQSARALQQLQAALARSVTVPERRVLERRVQQLEIEISSQSQALDDVPGSQEPAPEPEPR